MKKFVTIHRKGESTIQEVECEPVFTYSWEEARFIISAPKELSGEVWCAWAFHETEIDAVAKMNFELRREFEIRVKNSPEKFDEQGFTSAVNAVKIIKLPVEKE